MSAVKIINYSEDLKEHVRILNEEWLRKYFRVEPLDEVQLSNPKDEIIDKGGYIYYATYNGDVIGTASLLKVNAQEYELGKMAVTERAQGLGAGKLLMDHCIAEAKRMGVKKLILFSNRSLGPAIHIYKKYGFAEAEMEPGHYERADIKMEKIL